MDPLREVVDSNPKKGDAGGLSAILNAKLDEVEKRESEISSTDKRTSSSTSSKEEKPAKEAETGQAEDKEHSEDGKPEPKANKPKEPAKQAKEAPKAAAEDTSFAPKSWTEEQRKAFDAAPPEIQQAINGLVKNLQGGFTKKTQALAESDRIATEVRSALQPHHRELLSTRGISEGQAFRELLGIYDSVRSDPVSFIQHLIKVNGITPDHLGFTAQQATEQTQPNAGQAHPDPEVAQLKSELAALKGVLTEAHTRQVHATKQQKDAAIHDAHNVIVNFINEVDDAGMPAHPHWDTVQHHVMMIAENDPDIVALPPGLERLQAAYERAVWANPVTKQAMLEEERARTTAEVEQARARSALSVKPRGGNSSAIKGEPKSLDQLIRKNAQKFGNF